MRTTFPILLLLIAIFSQRVVNGQARVRHIIVIGSDGFGGYAFAKAKVPNLRQLMKEGSWSLEARAVLPSSSAPNWAAMMMGVGTELHGFNTCCSVKPDFQPRVLDQYGMSPSIYSVLRQARPESEIGVIYEWNGIGYLFPKAAVNKDLNPANDADVAREAAAYIESRKPTFLFVHLHDVDSVGHLIGHDTPEYYQAIERTDTHIGTILQSVKDAGIEKETVILFTADHGGVGKGHGKASMAEMQIPWIIKGPRIRTDHAITSSIMTFDTAPTLAKLLSLSAPQVWTGKPVEEAFK